jgi:hypothetical protein
MDYEENKDNINASSFDNTNSKNLAIRKLLNECNQFARTGNMAQWKFTLDRLRMEILGDIKKLDKYIVPEEKKNSVKIISIRKEIETLNLFKDKIKAYKLLEDYEEYLRDIRNETQDKSTGDKI